MVLDPDTTRSYHKKQVRVRLGWSGMVVFIALAASNLD